MAFRDLIPWGRQENRPPSTTAERGGADHPLFSLHREVDRVFDDMFRGVGLPALAGFGGGVSWPHVELSETDKDVRITAELPGLDQKEVQVTAEDGVLTIKGEKRAETEDRDRGYSERSYGHFERRIGLPKGIDLDKTNATFNNGVLSISVPKSAAADEAVRRIPISTSTA